MFKIHESVLGKKMCAEIIANAQNFEYDIIKKDIAKQDVTYDKATLDANTVEQTHDDSFPHRRVAQSPVEPIFKEWDGLPVYRCKVMKYETGDFVNSHRDAQWMCMSNYWEPNTNKSSESVMIIPLNDDYEGGDFTVNGQPVTQRVGDVIQVPCDALDIENNPTHGVKEVTRGTRYSLVFWNFK